MAKQTLITGQPITSSLSPEVRADLRRRHTEDVFLCDDEDIRSAPTWWTLDAVLAWAFQQDIDIARLVKERFRVPAPSARGNGAPGTATEADALPEPEAPQRRRSLGDRRRAVTQRQGLSSTSRFTPE